MNPDDWQRIKDLLLDALDLPVSDRRPFLEEALAGKPAHQKEALDLLDRMVDAGHLETDDGVRRLGEFELYEELGRGGVGVVYRAYQSSLKREVAIKVLASSASLDPRQVERFRREGSSAGKLTHPGILPVFDVREESGIWFLVMELVRGHDLAKELELQREPTAGGQLLPPSHDRAYIPAAAKLCQDVALALQYAHSAGIVHRDVKPHNLLLQLDGSVRLGDFGLARDESQGSISRSGEVEGTPYYMSPEQARGQRRQVDHRTDIYSAGVVLYELLALKRPFEGNTSAQVISHIVTRDPRPLRKLNPRIPRDLALICANAMHKDPRARYQTGGEFAADLGRFLNHEAVHATGASLSQRIHNHLRRRVRIYAALALTVVASVLALQVNAVLAANTELSALESIVQALPESHAELASVQESLPAIQASLVALSQHPRASSANVREAQQALQLIERFARDLEQRGRQRIKDSSPSVTDPRSPSESLFYLGLSDLSEAARLLPDDEDLAAAAQLNTYLPRLLVEGFHTKGSGPDLERVFVQEILGDGTLSDPKELSAQGSGGDTLPIGIYRITAFGPGGYGELSRTLRHRNRTYTVRPSILPTAATTDAMIEIPAGRARVGTLQGGWLPWYDGHDVDLARYWIDPMEVTNGEYRAYVEATGADEPNMWPRIPAELRPAEWDQLPVLGVTFAEAQAYAHWIGKRLPTFLEWQVAARGRDAWRYPWAKDNQRPEDHCRVGVITPPETIRALIGTPFAGYLDGVAPVGSYPDARSPFGLFDTLGNVREWTETPVQTDLKDWPKIALSPSVEFGLRIQAGCDWTSTTVAHLAVIGQKIMFSASAGFRCAKSAF